jgi:hypothetical protein
LMQALAPAGHSPESSSSSSSRRARRPSGAGCGPPDAGSWDHSSLYTSSVACLNSSSGTTEVRLPFREEDTPEAPFGQTLILGAASIAVEGRRGIASCKLGGGSMMSRTGAAIGVGAVLIPTAFGWNWLYWHPTVLLCLRCRKQIPGNSRFCPNCGVDLYGAPPPPSPSRAPEGPYFCTECGRPLKASTRFCGSCGAPVS